MRQFKINIFIYLPLVLAFISHHKLSVSTQNKMQKWCRKDAIPFLISANSEKENSCANSQDNTNSWISTFAELSPCMIRGMASGNQSLF